MLFNRKTLVLYDNAKTAVAERKVGESMEVVDAAQVLSWLSTWGTSANMLYNQKTRILYDDLLPTQLGFLHRSGPRDDDDRHDDMADDDNHRSDDMTGDDNDGDPRDNDGSDSPDTLPRKRRIVDVTVDDPDWEDEDPLPGLGTTTHRRHNPHLSVNPRRKQRRRVVAGPNVRATATRRRKEGMKRLDTLAADLDAWEVEREERVHELAEKHGMKLKEVRRRMLALSTYGVCRKPSSYNAKISRIMADLNKSRDVGERYTMPQVKLMVADDPSMLEGFSKEEEKEMIEAILTKREGKRRGTCANNLAAAADARRTMDRLMTEIASLAERVGMIGFAMFSCGHVHDKSLPVTIQSWGVLDFFLEVLKRDPADVSSLFELWAVTCERGKSNKNRLLTMQQEGTAIITMGLQKILGVTKCAMTYEGYIDKLVRGKGVGLVNWPEGVDFKRMSLQSVIGPLEKLLDSLKCGTTRWKVLTAGEKQQLIAQYEEMVERGEVKAKSGKTGRAKSRKVEDDNDEEPPARKRAMKRKRSARNEEAGEEANDEAPVRMTATKPKRRSKPPARNEETSEDEDDNDAPPTPKPAAKPKHPSKPSVPADDTGEDNDDEPPARKTAAKRKRPTQLSAHFDENSDDADSEPPPPKALAKRACTAATVKSKSSLGPRAGKDKNAKGGSKKKKHVPEEEDGDPVDSASHERPRLKPLYRKKTAMEGPSASSDAREGSSQDVPDLPPTSGRSTPSVAASSTATGSGRPNTVRGSRKGPLGMKVWQG
ncbi:hypothetical protein B0H14DRAFT_3454093 [Mycena olivaceomarginata]|nr:hypothetical protein B0H14DRAFT_3454093 [Mycena olivaceomarginata]